MTGTRPHAIPGDVTIITAPAPQDADAVTSAVARTLAAARIAGLPMPDYLHQHAGASPSAGLQFTARPGPEAAWDALRAWARQYDTTVIAAESATRPGTYTGRATWTSDGIEFEAYAAIPAAPQEAQ